MSDIISPLPGIFDRKPGPDKEPYAEMTQDELQEGIHGVMRHPRANGDGNGMWMCKRQPGPLACFAELVVFLTKPCC